MSGVVMVISARTPPAGVFFPGSAEHEALRLVGRARDQIGDLGARPAPLPEHVGRDDLRVAGIRAPYADANALEVGRAEFAAQRAQAVVALQAAAELNAHGTERQVDLVVHRDHAVELEPVGPARRAGRAPGLVHVGLRAQDRDARPTRPGPPLAQLPGELALRARELPALGQRLGDAEADVVRRVGVSGPGVAEPDDK